MSSTLTTDANTTTEKLKTCRSRKRSVSLDGEGDGDTGNESRITFSRSNVTSHSIPEVDKFKSSSLSFNFTPQNQGSVSFTSTGGTKWWKSKFAKKLIRSVRPKQRNPKYPVPLPRGSNLTQNSFELKQNPLDLKIRKVEQHNKDFDLIIGYKGKKYRHQNLQTRVKMADMDAFYKSDSNPQDAAEDDQDDDVHSEGDGTPESLEIGPGGECLQRGGRQEKSRRSNNDFSTPRQSLTEMESDASFVICDATEEIDASGKGSCNKEDKKKNQTEYPPGYVRGRGDSGNMKNPAPVPDSAPIKARRKNLPTGAATASATASEGKEKNVNDNDCPAKPSINSSPDSSEKKEKAAGGSLVDDEEELIKNALDNTDEEMAAKLESFIAAGRESHPNFPGIGGLNPGERRGFRVPPFMIATIIALLLQYAILPIFRRFFEG